MFDDELAAVPAHPPRAGALPGMGIGSALPRPMLLMLLAFVVLFSVLPLTMISSDPRARLSIGPSRTAEGRVLSVTELSGCRNTSAHRLVYAFPTDSRTEFRGTSAVCEGSPYYSAQAGDPIQVRYLARDPALNAIAGTESQNQPPIFFFLIFPWFFLLFFAPLFWPQLREAMRARRLYRTGVVHQGQVVFVKKRSPASWPGWPGSTLADVYVAYRSPSGQRAESVAPCMNDWLLNQLPPGTAVRILLPPDGSGRGALLEAYVR